MQIWMLLVVAAMERKSYTYGQIAEILGMGGAGVMAQFLGPIMWYCKKEKFPALTVIVVACDTGVPGDGLITIKKEKTDGVKKEEDVDKERERVFNFNWFAEEPPTELDFERLDEA